MTADDQVTRNAKMAARMATALADAGAPLPLDLFVPVIGTNPEADLIIGRVRDALDGAGIAYKITGDRHRTGLKVTDGPVTYSLAHTREQIGASA